VTRRVSDEVFHDFFCEISQSWMFNFWKFTIFVILKITKIVKYHNLSATFVFDCVPVRGCVFSLFRWNVAFPFICSILHRPTITTMTCEEDRQRVAQENMTRLPGISRHNIVCVCVWKLMLFSPVCVSINVCDTVCVCVCMYTVVCYESIKRELNIKSIYECRCDERLQTKTRKLRSSHTLGWPWNWNT
jgi:hypothetical protein